MPVFTVKETLAAGVITVAMAVPLMACAADPQRQAEVAERGRDVMPFSLAATVHTFIKTTEGGIQRVVVKDTSDTGQTEAVRRHLQDVEQQFLKEDFSGPAHIHGNDMPGLAQLAAAQPGDVSVSYQDVDGGGELEYKTADPRLAEALHTWFDAQLSDHGPDAMTGHQDHPAALPGQ